MKRIGKRTIIFENKPRIISYGSVVGKKEHEGPLSNEFLSLIHISEPTRPY